MSGADRFDGKIDDVFSLQDTFVHKIVDALEINLTKPEQEQIASVRTTMLRRRKHSTKVGVSTSASMQRAMRRPSLVPKSN
jgi:hypothetical protein